MRKAFILSNIGILFTCILFLSACQKDQNLDTSGNAKVQSVNVTNLKDVSVTVAGFILTQGGNKPSEVGICWNTAPEPTTANNKVAVAEYTASIVGNLTGLSRLTKYYARAYVISGNGTFYGEDITFTTTASLPTVTTTAQSAVTATPAKGVTALTGGKITDDGGAAITARGIVIDTVASPTISSTKTSDGKGAGVFVSAAENLKGKKTYYVRAYATNAMGTSYGNEVSFKTPTALPVATIATTTKITKFSATLNGEITDDGAGKVTERGFCYGLNADPTILDSKVLVGTGKGLITADIITLVVNTKYHVRAYAINEAGINYSADATFSTLADILKMYVVGDYNSWGNNDKAKFILSTTTSNGTAEGYVNLSVNKDGNKLTTDFDWNDANTFGDNGTKTGILKNGGNNITIPDVGYYFIKANVGTMTYSFTKTNWGIIGDATAGGWDSQTDMVYDVVTEKFSLTATLTGGKKVKFRGTADWAINYGGDIKALTLGGADIPVVNDGDYYIVLDLSTPNAYTASFTTWGLVGDATGSWDVDKNMTWDAANKVWKIKTDLVVGKIKFRANDGWDINLGGADFNALTQGGADIAIATAGSYTITLDALANKCTVTKN